MKATIYAVLTLSGIANGQTIANRYFLDAIAAEASVKAMDLGPGRMPTRSRLVLWVVKAFKSLWYAGAILKMRSSKHAAVYMSASATWGQLTDCLLACAARCRGVPILIHHHTYSHIHRYDWRMALLCRLTGKAARHVVLCSRMARELMSRYPVETIVVANPVTVPLLNREPTDHHESAVCLGHLSNLSMEKGLAEVVATFEKLRAGRTNATLLLAGPIMGANERHLIDQVLLRYPDHVSHMGVVAGDRKSQFYLSIDVFLFPTKYRNEASPLVLVEAMASGVPVITVDRACIGGLVGEGGVVVAEDDDYVTRAVAAIDAWMHAPEAYRTARERAYEQGEEIRRRMGVNKEMLLDELRRMTAVVRLTKTSDDREER